MTVPKLNDVLQQLREFNNHDLPRYTGIVTKSFKRVNPVFLRPKYADFFVHCATTVPFWLEEVVVTNSLAESEGSKRLLGLWQSLSSTADIENAILAHARDESRHSHIFLKLASLAFKSSISDHDLLETKTGLTKINRSDLVKVPEELKIDTLFDNLIQINMAEIRTLIHMHFIGPAIYSQTAKEDREKVSQIIQGLARDEIRHIGYTSKLIEEWCVDDNEPRASYLYSERLAYFQQFTVAQTEKAVAMYGANKYPELLEI